jgi:hypothetical protein
MHTFPAALLEILLGAGPSLRGQARDAVPSSSETLPTGPEPIRLTDPVLCDCARRLRCGHDGSRSVTMGQDRSRTVTAVDLLRRRSRVSPLPLEECDGNVPIVDVFRRAPRSAHHGHAGPRDDIPG